MGQTIEKDSSQEGLLSAWSGQAKKKGQPKSPSFHQLPEARKRLWLGHSSYCWGSQYPYTFGASNVPVIQAAVPHLYSTLAGAELPKARKKTKGITFHAALDAGSWVPGGAEALVIQATVPPGSFLRQTQVLQGRLRSKALWMTHIQRWR